jgi:transposase InsO family protein
MITLASLGCSFCRKNHKPQGTLKKFLRRAQNEFGLRIKKIRSDNGTEFKNSQIEGFLEEEGIKHEFSSPYTPQQNSVVERKNRTLLDMARTAAEPPELFQLKCLSPTLKARPHLNRNKMLVPRI